MHPDPQTLIVRGQNVARLLAEDAFADAINDVSAIHLSGMAAAPPGEAGKAARDYHHLLHYALAELVDTLRGYVVTGEEMEQLAQLPEELDDL